MKKKVTLLASVPLLLLFACKKDRTCECTTTETTTAVHSNGTTSVFIDGPKQTTVVYKDAKKSNLKSLCGNIKLSETDYEKSASSTISYTYATNTKCELK